jgi:hypothetical protein
VVYANLEIPSYEPFGNVTVVQATANSIPFLSGAIVVTIFLVALVKFGFRRLFVFFIAVLPLFAIFTTTQFYTAIIFYNLRFADLLNNILSIILALVLSLIAVYATMKTVEPLLMASTVIISAELGSILALFLKPPTLFILPIVFALYDIFAVFRGPLKLLMKEIKKYSRGKKKGGALSKIFGILVVSIGGINIGAGDLIFYSMIVSAGYLIKSVVGMLYSLLAVNIGVFLTGLIFLKYKKMLPGLPIPIVFGTFALILL